MKKIIILCLTGLIILGSIGVSALDKGTSKLLKDENFTGWFYDRNIKNWNYIRNGEIVKGDWVNDNNLYYLKDDGSMSKGWQQINNKWYYFSSIGIMKTGWLKDGSNWYYLNSDGTMAHDTNEGSYYLGSNGVWVQ